MEIGLTIMVAALAFFAGVYVQHAFNVIGSGEAKVHADYKWLTDMLGAVQRRVRELELKLEDGYKADVARLSVIRGDLTDKKTTAGK